MFRLCARVVTTHLVVGLSGIVLVGLAAWSSLTRAAGAAQTGEAVAAPIRGSAPAALLGDVTLLVGATVAVTVVVLGSLLAGMHPPWRPPRRTGGQERAESPGLPDGVAPGGWPGARLSACPDRRGAQDPIRRDLETLRRELADIEGRRRQLLGDVAHEMRTPLTIIDGYVEGMIDGIIPAEADELVHVSDEVRRLRRLADDLSALSQVQEGRLELRPMPMDLRGVVSSAAERLRPQVEDAAVQLQVVPGSDTLPVAVDQDRLSQVVRNLIGNAVRATAPGGQISLRLGQTDRWAWFSVRDTGEGIDSSDLDRIFERFYRVAGRRSARGETGSGIGLTIARDIVRAHGGELIARSAGRGCGAEFIAWLPRSPEAPR